VASAFDRALREAIAAETSGVAGGELVRASEALSRRYRAGGGAIGPGRLTAIERLAYATVRLPATAAALDAAFGALARHGRVSPATILDLGAGPATVLWPARARWPQLTRATLVDRDPDMLRLGLRLWAHAWPVGSGGPEIATRTGDLASTGEGADLVVAAYAIGELDDASAARAVDRALAQAGRAVVLVEPGTPAGFARIRAARERLIAHGATIVAPCPHDGPCPMSGDDWCHFAVRLDRSRTHRHAKQAALGWEDEKFAYVVAMPASASPGLPAPARIVRRPVRGTGHVRLVLCAPAGLEDAVVTRREPGYRAARDAEWGDPWPPPPESTG